MSRKILPAVLLFVLGFSVFAIDFNSSPGPRTLRTLNRALGPFFRRRVMDRLTLRGDISAGVYN
jgi:hypothetical protein